MKKEKIYISGAIAHHDLEDRKVAFALCAAYCRHCGYEPVTRLTMALTRVRTGMYT